uniref:Putative oxygenase n=1 Tax=Streptomyces griseoviridis TaxID=45398 RepID=B6VRR3_STRGD|nr:putative oxygenase [Streptomyces griseoviridis]
MVSRRTVQGRPQEPADRWQAAWPIMVMCRDARGNAVVQEARCPHKGANLGAGRISRNALECPYHGFRFGADGDCEAVPCLGSEARIPKGLRIRNYPVREENDLVWMWWGEERESYPGITAPWEAARHTGVHATGSWQRPLNYTRYIESMLEFYHTPFVHSRVVDSAAPTTCSTARRGGFGGTGGSRYVETAKVVDHKVETEGTTLRSSFRLVREEDEDDPAKGEPFTIVFTFPGMVHVVNARFDFTMWITPVDEDHTQILFRWYEAAWLRPFLPSRLLRGIAPGLGTVLQRMGPEPQDMRVIADMHPKVSRRGAYKFVAADEMNARYLTIRHRLLHGDPPPEEHAPAQAGPGRQAGRAARTHVRTT